MILQHVVTSFDARDEVPTEFPGVKYMIAGKWKISKDEAGMQEAWHDST